MPLLGRHGLRVEVERVLSEAAADEDRSPGVRRLRRPGAGRLRHQAWLPPVGRSSPAWVLRSWQSWGQRVHPVHHL